MRVPRSIRAGRQFRGIPAPFVLVVLGAALWASAAGSATSVDGALTAGEPQGSDVDPSWMSGVDNTLLSMVLQPDARVVIEGTFGNVDGVSRVCVARLNADGSLDPSFEGPGSAACGVRSADPWTSSFELSRGPLEIVENLEEELPELQLGSRTLLEGHRWSLLSPSRVVGSEARDLVRELDRQPVGTQPFVLPDSLDRSRTLSRPV